MLDQLTAWVIVYLLIVSPWAPVVLLSVLAGFLAGWFAQSRRRGGLVDQRTAVAALGRRVADLAVEPARLQGELTEARMLARLDRAAAAAAAHRAARAHFRASALAQDNCELQAALANARDQVSLALLEAGTEWEVDPR